MYKDRPNRTVELYLDDILDAIRRIKKYTKDMTFEEFAESDLVFDAVIKNFIVIGEALNHISPKFMKEHRDIPWREIIAMRNRMVHEYFAIKKEVVWNTAKKDMLFLTKEIKKLKERVK